MPCAAAVRAGGGAAGDRLQTGLAPSGRGGETAHPGTGGGGQRRDRSLARRRGRPDSREPGPTPRCRAARHGSGPGGEPPRPPNTVMFFMASQYRSGPGRPNPGLFDEQGFWDPSRPQARGGSTLAIHESRYAANPHHNKKGKIDRLAIGKSAQSIESNFRAGQSKAVHRAFVDSEEPKHAECSNALRSSVPARCFRRTVDAIHKGAGPGSNC